MAGRGRGRGTLGGWGPSPGTVFNGGYDGRAVASVPPLQKEMPSALGFNLSSGSDESGISCVRVTCIIDVNHFWAQLGSQSELERFDNYMYALNHWCDNQITGTVNEMPGVGQVVCVKHVSTGIWRRAEVTRLCQRMVDVFFLDFGEAECVPLEMLCSKVPRDVTSWPPQALYCTLEGVQPPPGEDQWSEKAVRRFTSLVTCGQRIAASHERGSFQLKLYLTNDIGTSKSVGSILIEEGLAQVATADHVPSGGSLWQNQSPRQHHQDRPKVEKPDLDKLEQQLMMSGFSYLLPSKFEESEANPPKDFSYESTTISSSYYTYKGKDNDNHGSAMISDEQHPLVSQYHSSYKHFQPPSTQVLPSNSMPGFSPIRDRNHQPGPAYQHISCRPHLASPGEFMSSSKPQMSSQLKHQEHGSVTPEGKKLNRYVPPPLGLQTEEHGATPRGESLQQTSWDDSHDLVNNTWSPSEQQPPNHWQEPHVGDLKENTAVGSCDMYLHGPQYPEEESEQLHTEAEVHEPHHTTALQHHLEGPSAFHEPKDNSFPLPFNLPVKNEKVEVSQAQAQQQPTPPINKPPLSDDQKKTMKNELNWKKWKFQRNVKRVLEKVIEGNVDDLGCDLGMMISESSLSRDFQGVSEVMIVVEMIFEKVLDKNEFACPAAKMCQVLSGLEISGFSSYFCKVITSFRDDIVEHRSISNWKCRCNRFCTFMGEMFLNTLVNGDPVNHRQGPWFKSTITSIVGQSLQKFTLFDENKPEDELEVITHCLVSLLKCIGPSIEEKDGGRLVTVDVDIEQTFGCIRNHVLSTSLPSSVRSDLLDLMLLRSAGWPSELPDAEPEWSDDGVLVETDENQDDESASEEREDTERQDEDDWNPYARIHAMLENLKLEDLFAKFEDNCIRDSLLAANKEDFKKTLQEAGFPPGVILEIQIYLQKGEISMPIKTRKSKDEKSKDSQNSTPASHKRLNSMERADQHKTNEKILHEDEGEKSRDVDTKRTLKEHVVQDGDVSVQSSKADQGRFASEQTGEESKGVKMDGHNLFEPSYLNRTPPLKVETSSAEYETRPESPANQGPMSYSAVLKAKNDDSPEAPKQMPVKLTSLTKTAEGSGREQNQALNKQPVSKNTPKEASKESSNRRDQGSSTAKPPPGFPPLPPQNWGQSPEIRLTVLGSRQRGRPEDGGTVVSSGDQNWKRNSDAENSEGRGSRGREGGSFTRGGWMGGRGGTGHHGRPENRKGGSDNVNMAAANQWQGKSTTGPTNWRRKPDTSQDLSDTPSYDKRKDKRSSSPYGGGFARPKPHSDPWRPPASGRPKACSTCGSREHLACDDRSKMFFE